LLQAGAGLVAGQSFKALNKPVSAQVGLGRIVFSEIEVPILLVNLV
jgi:hypothetical protein